MRVMMPASPAATNAVTCPSLHARPAHREQEDAERERNGDPRHVEDVAKRVIRRRLLERLRLLHQRDEHHTSVAPQPKLR